MDDVDWSDFCRRGMEDGDWADCDEETVFCLVFIGVDDLVGVDLESDGLVGVGLVGVALESDGRVGVALVGVALESDGLVGVDAFESGVLAGVGGLASADLVGVEVRRLLDVKVILDWDEPSGRLVNCSRSSVLVFPLARQGSCVWRNSSNRAHPPPTRTMTQLFRNRTSIIFFPSPILYFPSVIFSTLNGDKH